MKDNAIRVTGQFVEMPRRTFLRNCALLSVPVAFAGLGLPMPARAAAYNPPSRKRGSAQRNVKDYGAVGNGVHDDTSAFQAAINALPSTGGTVVVPAGSYLIDAVRSVKLRSLMHLKLDPKTKLIAKPNSSARSIVLELDVVHDVEISGGQIVGERDKHKGTSGEGGHCIHVGGSSRITIRDILCSKGWGDGISVGPKAQHRKTFIYSQDVAVANVVCTGNRRNGLSITNVIGMKVFDSEFSDTHGTSPQCGIDVEPNKDIDGKGYNDQVWIENCVMRGNAAYGVNVWNRARNLTITKCTIIDNGSCGIVTTGLVGGTFTGNTVCNSSKTGMAIKEGTTNFKVSGNTFYKNYTIQGIKSRTPFSLTGVSSKVQKDLTVGRGTSKISVGTNRYQ
jgi:hypothetical protein